MYDATLTKLDANLEFGHRREPAPSPSGEKESAGAADATRKACALYAAVLPWALGCGRSYFLTTPSQFSTTVTGADGSFLFPTVR